MRTMSWIVLSGLVAMLIGCQRAEKPSGEKDSPAAPISTAEAPAETSSLKSTESEASRSAASDSKSPALAEPATGDPATSAKTAVAEVEPAAQPTAAKPTTEKPIAPEAAKAAGSAKSEGAAATGPTKAEIINSPQFRRAIFEFNEWLTSQPIYTPQQVAQIKDQFNHRVAEMNAQELTYLLNDLEAKMHLINTPEAREARAWMAQYLSVMSDRKRAEVLKDVPNVATMTAAQLADELSRIQEKRATMDSEQAAFQKGQAAQVAQQVQTDRIAQQNFVRDWNTGPVAYSPYSSGGSNVNERLNNTPIGAGMSFYTGGWGGVGIAFSPSAW